MKININNLEGKDGFTLDNSEQMRYKLFILLLLLSSITKLHSQDLTKLDTIQADTSFINQVLDVFALEVDDNIPEAQRSKRKQVDALLSAILQQPGQLQFSGVATATFQTEIQQNNSYQGVGTFDIFAFTSFGKHTLLFFDLEAIGGNGPDVLIPNISVLNAIAGSTTSTDGIDRLTVLEAWTEFKALRDIFTVTLGKIDLTNYFDNNLHANDETSQFITGVFVNNPVLPIYFNSPGIRFRTSFLGRFYIQYGLGMANLKEIDLMKNHFKILETGFKLFPETGWEANLRFMGYEHPLAGSSQGFGISVDQLIANHVTIFGRYGKNKIGLAEWHGIEKAWSAGIGFQKMVLRKEYKIGIAYAETFQVDKIRPEKVAECYISNQLNKWLFVSPHFQWLQNGQEELIDHYILGLRLNFSY